MLAAICLFLPACMSVYLWESYVNKEIPQMTTRIFRYICGVLGINGLVILAVNCLAKNSGNITYKITNYSDFAIKYLVLALIIAIGIPIGYKYFKERVNITVKKPSGKFQIPWRTLIILYAVILLGLNFIRIFDNNFWGDEAYSLRLAKMSVSGMVQATAADVHPPLYYLVLIGAYRLFGDHGWVYHVVSFMPYLITTVFILTVIWKKFGKETAFLMLTLTSLVSTAVTYNVEVRMYSLANMFVLFAFYGLYLIFEKKNGGGVPVLYSSFDRCSI